MIACSEREALYVLDGLLENDTVLEIKIHHTDTHGVTDQVCGLCFLLGFSFMPRIKDAGSRRLFRPSPTPEGGLFGAKPQGHLDAIFSGTVDLDLIREQWDSLVRVAASLKNRVVPASLLATRLASQSNRLAKALVHLGRLVRTTYLLGYFCDEALRKEVERQLNRGERRQKLARHVFFAHQGEFQTGDYFEIMNKASCLSLISNAILVYNTPRVVRIIEQARQEGQVFSEEAIAHVTPLLYRHVLVNGTYDFTRREQA